MENGADGVTDIKSLQVVLEDQKRDLEITLSSFRGVCYGS